MAMQSITPAGEFKTSYAADTTIFPSITSRNATILGVLITCCAPFVFSSFILSMLIQIGYLSIAALGLNILVGFTGQISIGHAAFFGFGAFSSAYVSNIYGVPVFLAVPLAGVMTTAVGLIFGLPAARLKGLYLAIATLAAQYILQDFFARANWFTGGALYAHYLQYVSVEGFTILFSIQFLGMIIIGGLGSIMGTIMGTAFMVLLPEGMEWLTSHLAGSAIDQALGLRTNISYLREVAIGAVIIVFLIFEPDGLAHRWKQIKAYWKLYPFSH
jgi:ABC-type branched-subunit amino acid transport system permease subunit